MSLIVTLTYGSTTYNIRAENLSHTFTRLPTQAPLPADNSGNPHVFIIDLGMSMESITFQATINTTSSGAGDPGKVDLENACRTWWAYGASDPSQLPTLTISSGQSYQVAIKNAEFIFEGGIEDRWRLTMISLVANKN